MALTIKKDKKPRGRRPLGAVLVDGRWHLTQESLQLAAERVIRYREHNRKRYHEMRDLLRKEHPELFAPPREDPRQTPLTDDAPLVRSNERVCDLTCYQKDSSSSNSNISSFSASASLPGNHSGPENGSPSVLRA